MVAPAASAARRHDALARVDADAGAVAERIGQGADHRDGQRGLGLGVDLGVVAVRVPRAGRLGPDVEDLGAGRDEPAGLLERRSDHLVRGPLGAARGRRRRTSRASR